MDDLQEMREQMAALKEKLNKQEVVSEQLLRKMIAKKVKEMRKAEWASIAIMALCLIGLLVLNFVYQQWDFWSIMDVLFWFIVLSVDSIFAIIQQRIIRVKDLYSSHIKEMAEQIAHIKYWQKVTQCTTLGVIICVLVKNILENVIKGTSIQTITMDLTIYIIMISVILLLSLRTAKRNIKEWKGLEERIAEMTDFAEEKEENI